MHPEQMMPYWECWSSEKMADQITYSASESQVRKCVCVYV